MRRAARRDQFGIVALDRGGDDDHRGVADICSASWPMNTVAPCSRRRLTLALSLSVRALNLVAEVEQHLGDARHADAADADEMDGADLARQFHA